MFDIDKWLSKDEEQNELYVRYIFPNEEMSKEALFANTRILAGAIGFVTYRKINGNSVELKRYYLGKLLSLMELGFSLDKINELNQNGITRAVRIRNGKIILVHEHDLIMNNA